MAETPPPTVEQILSKLFEMRNEREETPEDIEYVALHVAFLFLSYQRTAFEQYLEDLRKK